ncbi:hypothetical protein SAMN02910353_01268 [Ruminococcus sp. YRD2003]|uniref:hypothetical protein n=1 Tax=Ruminococcus sp. YRD2003 TaxID=1452313 RepID=UPI0008B6304E|nr:hypothetical protein SAMN02910353_01268 [Ruminococcus flavefaciens]
MLGTLLVIGAAAALAAGAGVLIHAYWKNIIQWLAKAAEKIKAVLNVAVEGSQTFIKRVGSGFKNMSENYSKLPEGKWRKDTVIEQKYIDENEVPDDIRQLMNQSLGIEGEKIEITSYVEKQVLTLKNA